MKSCPRCGSSYADSAITCECGYEFQPVVAGTGNNPAFYSYNSTYHTARGIAKFISAVGWIVTAIGALFFLVALSESGGARLLSLPSLVGTLGGLLLVGTGQFTRAAVDTADHTGEMLAIMKASQQLPKG
jgi:hypothetical protein